MDTQFSPNKSERFIWQEVPHLCFIVELIFHIYTLVNQFWSFLGDVYDVVITTDQIPRPYWIRVQGVAGNCVVAFQQAVLQYEGDLKNTLPLTMNSDDLFNSLPSLPVGISRNWLFLCIFFNSNYVLQRYFGVSCVTILVNFFSKFAQCRIFVSWRNFEKNTIYLVIFPIFNESKSWMINLATQSGGGNAAGKIIGDFTSIFCADHEKKFEKTPSHQASSQN